MEYKEYRLNEIMYNFKYGTMPKKDKIRNINEGKYPIYTGYLISGYYDECNIENETLIVVARGVGGTGDVKLTPKKCYLTNLSIAMFNDERIASNRYLYYYFKIHNLRYLDSGSAQSQITINDLKNVKVPIPDTNIQQRVVNILEKLDEKIELNNKINDNLYELLNKYFKHTFEDFSNYNGILKDSEIGKIPENFKVIELNNIIKIRGGLAYKASNLSDDSNDNILISMANVELKKIFNFNNLKHYSDDADKKYIAEVGDLFICTRDVTQQRKQLGCVGKIPKVFEDKNVIIGTNLYMVEYKEYGKILNNYLYLLLNSYRYRERIVGCAKGTAVLMIAKEDVLNFKFAFPTDFKIIEDFNKIVQPIFDRIEENICQNNTLEQLREILLPKLMNGEIDLDKIEI